MDEMVLFAKFKNFSGAVKVKSPLLIEEITFDDKST